MVMALALVVREAWALSKKYGGFRDLTDESKGREPYCGNKPPLRLGTRRPLRLTRTPPLPRLLVLALTLSLAVREDLAISKKEGGFGDLTDGLKGRDPS